MQKKTRKVETYDLNNGFRVDVEKEEAVIEFWLYRFDVGIKTMIFGLPSAAIKDIDHFVNGFPFDPYIEGYIKEYV